MFTTHQNSIKNSKIIFFRPFGRAPCGHNPDLSPCWFWKVDQVQPWPLCFPQHPCIPVPPPAPLLLGHPDQNHAMSWHDMDITMPSPPPLTSNMHHLVQDLPLSLLVVLDPALSQGDDDRGENVTCPDVITTPERAPSWFWMRQDTPCPRRIRPPLDLSLHPPAHLNVSNLLDIAIGSLAPCRRRHG